MSAVSQPVETIVQRRWFNVTLVSVLVGGLVACGGGGGGGSDRSPVMGVDVNGTSTISAEVLATQLATYPLASLAATEVQSLLFMREEEQLAHDVYAVSASLWAPPIFANISASEATHSAAMKALIDRYQLVDPLAGLAEGTFKTPAFQVLYDALVAASRISLVEALKVGVEIEELDIRDITAQKVGIDNADILMVYDNLLRGSRNHLRAYMKVLTQQGGTYVPEYLGQAEFDAIVNSAIETGP